MKNKLKVIEQLRAVAKPAVFSLMGVALTLGSQSAVAGTFGVKVVNEAGQPVSGASVCVGLPGNYKQFGALFTDSNGQAIVEVPNMPIVVTVSKTRFSGMRISEPARGFNLIKEVTLAEGVPGPRCRAGSTLASNSSIVIDDIDVLEGVYSTTLRPTVSGEPSHYRVSRNKDFTGANWQPFGNDIALSSRLSDAPSVYLQMRRYEGSSNSWIEARSSVVTVQLPIIQ